MRIVIFEDEGYSNLYPLTYLRPSFDLRCGFRSLAAHIELDAPNGDVAYFVRDCLRNAFAETTDRPVNDPATLAGDDILLVNGRLLPEYGQLSGAGGKSEVALSGEQLAWAYISKSDADKFAADSVEDLVDKAKESLPSKEVECLLVVYPWDLILNSADRIAEDFNNAGRCGVLGEMSELSAIWGPRNRVYVAEGASIQPQVTLDASEGPIYIEKGVKIEADTRVEGPCYMGEETRVVGGKIRYGCSLGPVCRVGGEVEESIIHGYSNKYHDGFLGHAYVGEWVNLGAQTNNSDLKNDYSSVEVYINGELIDSGSRKVGAIIGDHTKTSIGTMLNTGTAIGVMCNLVGGSGILPKNLPNFSLFHEGRLYKLGTKQLLQTAETAMGRRDKKLTEAQAELIKHVFAATKEERDKLIKRMRR